ncbi:MAG: MopE-related protein [Myxococcota bacterium]
MLGLAFGMVACTWVNLNPKEACLDPCEGPVGTQVDEDADGVPANLDCDDTNAAVSPNADEVPYTGVDEDCDPSTPDDDLDEDGFGVAEDCDDANAEVSPKAKEQSYDGVDNDCDPKTLDDDLDQDGQTIDVDCDDRNETIYLGAPEICDDEIDQDCNGNPACPIWVYTVREDDDFLRRFDLTSDLIEPRGLLGVPFDGGDLAWDGSTMWMVDGDAGTNLYTVDPTTGAATLVGSHGVSSLSGLTYDPVSGLLLGSADEHIVQIDPVTVAVVEDAETPYVSLDGLAYDSFRSSRLGYDGGAGGFAGTLFLIDLYDSSLQPVYVDNTNFERPRGGLAYVPDLDEVYYIDQGGYLSLFVPAHNYQRYSLETNLAAHDGLSYGPQDP